MPHPFVEDFQKALQKDESRIKPFLISWKYQNQRASRSKRYDKGLPQDFWSFSGQEDLQKWVNWNLKFPHPGYFGDDYSNSLARKSWEVDRKIFEELGVEVDEKAYLSNLARSNMQDYRYAHLYPVPERQEPIRVLDFGAGYGRQANLWTQLNPEIRFHAVDAIPKAYCLQRLYYSHLDLPLFEYVENPQSFKLEDKAGIHHLPTWRTDLIPDNYLDMVVCIQVIPELETRLAKYIIKEFHRMLKPGGAVMLRDGEKWLRLGPGFSLRNYMRKSGFALEFRPYVLPGEDIHGIPRIWRKRAPEYESHFQRSRKEKMTRAGMYFDSKTGGLLQRIFKRKK